MSDKVAISLADAAFLLEALRYVKSPILIDTRKFLAANLQNRCSIIKNRYNLDIATENRITGSVKDSPSKAAKKDPHHQNSSRIAPSPANVLFEHDGHLTGEKNKSKLNATTDKIMILDGNDGAAAENSSSFDSADKGCSAHAGRGEKSGDNSLAAGIKDEEVIEGWGRSATGTSPCP